MLWSGGAATPHPVVQQGEAHPEQGDTRHALRRHVVPEPPPRTSERDRIWTGGDCGPQGVRRGRAGVGRPWSDTGDTDVRMRQTDTRRQRRGRERPADSSGAPRSSQSARGRTGRKAPSPPFPAGAQPADTPTPDLQGPLHAGPERRRKTGRGPHAAPAPPHPTWHSHLTLDTFFYKHVPVELRQLVPVGGEARRCSGLPGS